MTDRRQFLSALGAAPVLLQNRPRNILLMIADDLSLHTGAYGDAQARTPNLDALANEGVRFTHAFCTTASCSASRSVILSGLQNHANGQYGHAHSVHNLSYLPKVKPIPSLLKDAGYRTGVVGKLHVNPVGRFRWDLASEGGQRDVVSMADRARQFIQASGDAPWYLHMGYADPHRAANGFANQDYKGVKRHRFDPAQIRVPRFLPNNLAAREEVAEYYEASNRLDQGIGMMMNVLRETGQLDNTLVVFISDNGMPFPNAKTNLYDAGSRLPMIVRHPGQSKRGLVNEALVNWTDLGPSFLDWARAKGPEYPLHGRSWLPVLEQERPAGWEEVFYSHTFHEITMYYPTRGIRTRRYKYLRNLHPGIEFPHASDLWGSRTWQSLIQGGPEARIGGRRVQDYLYRAPFELYDMEQDPDELNNLAKSAARKAVFDELHRKTHEFRKRTGDPWLAQSVYSGEDPAANPPN